MAIRESIERVGYAPTIAEIRDALGLNSVHTTQRILLSLQRKGYIRRKIGKERAIALSGHNDAFARQMAALAYAHDSGETIVETARRLKLPASLVSMIYRTYERWQAT